MNLYRTKLLSLAAYAVIVSIALICASSCHTRKTAVSSHEEVARYLEAHTPGTVKAGQPIQFLFKDPGDSAGRDSIKTDRLLRFSPEIKGETVWDAAAHKLEFTPQRGQLRFGKTYICTLRTGMLFPGAKDLVFSFRVAGRAAEIEILETRISEENPEEALVRGRVTLSEPVKDGIVVPSLFKTSSSNRPEEVTVKRVAEDEFEFEMTGFKRLARGDSNASICFEAASIGFGINVGARAVIPGLEGFKVIETERVDAAEPYIEVRFSGLLDEKQSLEGLLSLEEVKVTRIEKGKAEARVFFEETNRPAVTLRIDPDIKSRDGKKLDTEYREQFRTEEIRPAVELLISDGILPDGENLKLPFRAVNLCAVDVSVIKVYRDNVLSFYQENSIRGDYELRRYGRLIYKTTARLDTAPAKNPRRWQNYSIDLKNLFRQEKGVIYRIKLSFRQEYSLYGRDELPELLPEATVSQKENDYWDATEYWYDPQDEYESGSWHWEERNDPLKPSYYMCSSRFPEVNLTASNIGIIAGSADNSRLWVTTSDINSSKPLAGVRITVYNYQLQPIATTTSDGNGFAELTSAGKPFIIQAEKGQSVSHLRMNSLERSLSHFDIGGKKISKGLKGFVYGERGVWRPGDTLHLTLLVEDRQNRLPVSHPATMELFTPEGRLFATKTLAGSVDGFYCFEVATEPESTTGSWSAVFTVGGAQFKHRVPIETIKPNRLKINLSTESGTLSAGKPADIGIAAHWLTGPAASGLNGTLDIILHQTTIPFPDYREYTFNNPLKQYKAENLTQMGFSLDSTGCAILNRTMPEAQGAPGMLKADLICSVAEPGGNNSIVANVVRFSPFSHYVGIDLSEDEFESDCEHAFKVVCVDETGNVAAGRTLQYRIYRLGWNWWWECDSEALNRYMNGTSEVLETSGKLTSTEPFTKIPFTVSYPDYGKFLILVTDTESGHTTGGTFFVDWPLWRGHSAKSDPEALTMLSFTTDKHSYEVGETSTVYLPVSDGGHALVSFENGSGVLSRAWVATSATAETAWKFRVTDKMAPNFYLHITLLQPHRQTLNDLPIRMYGVQNVTVSNPESHLKPVIDCPDVVRPQTPFTIRVKEERGKPMTYTIAIVDEGLLDLTGFQTPAPWTAMNEREALGVRTWDMYEDVIGAWAGKFTQILSLGGDMSMQGTKKENRFRPVVKFLGPFTLPRGTASHTVDLPMYVGSVRVMVVAGHAGAYGSAGKPVIVRSPLMLLPTLPRRLSLDESVQLPVNVFAMEQQVKDVNVKVEVSGPVRIDGQSTSRLHFAAPGDSLVSFALKTDAAKTGQATVTVSAEGGGFKTSETIPIDVVNPNPPRTTSHSKLLQAGEQADFSWKGRRPEEGETAVLEIAGFPAIDFTGAFEFVRSYRHLCTEQLSSNAFFLLYARDFLTGEDKKSAEELLPAMLSHLTSRQLTSGGFAYWPGYSFVNSWATSMAGQVLLEAKRQGFPVQQKAIDNWVKYQKQATREYKHSGLYNLDDLGQAYRLYTLALAGEADGAAMNRLKEKDGLSSQAQWRLAAAYAVAGKRETARQFTQESLLTVATPANGTGDTWWSSIRDRAMILDALVELGQNEKAILVASEVASAFSADHCSTQELAWTSRAMGTLAKAVGQSLSNVSFSQSNGSAHGIQGGRSLIQQTLDFAPGEVHVINNSSAAVYTHLTLRERADIHETVESSANGVSVSVEWKSIDSKPLDVKELRQGTEFRALITVKDLTGNVNSESMALTLTAPSGWEIWNDRLFGGEAAHDWIYRDIRDNEVRWYFSLAKGQTRQFEVRLQAAYSGEFHLPEIACEDMYNVDYKSNTASGTVCVRP